MVWEGKGSLKIYQEAFAATFYIILDFLIYKYYAWILLLCKRCISKQSNFKDSNLNINQFFNHVLALNGNIELSPMNAFGFSELNPSIQ